MHLYLTLNVTVKCTGDQQVPDNKRTLIHYFSQYLFQRHSISRYFPHNYSSHDNPLWSFCSLAVVRVNDGNQMAMVDNYSDKYTSNKSVPSLLTFIYSNTYHYRTQSDRNNTSWVKYILPI